MSDLLRLLREGRAREMDQARFYRALSTRADRSDDPMASERLNELLADEQHHVSRLTARMLELGGRPGDGAAPTRQEVELDGWESEAGRREAAEVAWYEAALDEVRDPPTRRILEEILVSERHHLEELGGKWMAASPPTGTDTDPAKGEGS